MELQERLGIPSNLLAHHLDVLQAAGLIARSPSSGDGRRRYLHLRREAFTGLVPERRLDLGSVLFVCTANSARSQLAAALATARRCASGVSGDPSGRPGASGRHSGRGPGRIRFGPCATPTARPCATAFRADVITVCDRAHEELDPQPEWLHWSIPDPVPVASTRAFNATVADLRERIGAMVDPGQVLV